MFILKSLSAWGIRDQNKRKAIFSRLQKQQAYITFLKETHNTPDVYSMFFFFLIYGAYVFILNLTRISRGMTTYILDSLGRQTGIWLIKKNFSLVKA